MNVVPLRLLAVSFLAIAVTGCSSLQGLGEKFGRAGSTAGTPPIVSDRFILEDDQQIVGELQVIYARDEDTFVDIARTYNLGFDELLEANPEVDPWLPGEGTPILLPTRFILPDTPRDGVVINLASKRLFYYPPADEDGTRSVITFPIGIGQQGSATPTGETTVTSKGKDPVWYVPASIRREYAAAGNPLPQQVPPGPDNPLGSHVLVLGMPSYLIHGTNRPAGVGMRVSHGCVRLFPENIEHLYGIVPVGVAVTIVNQPWVFGWQGRKLFVEAHPPLLDDEQDWDTLLPQMLEQEMVDQPNGTGVIDQQKLAVITSNAMGIPVPLLSGDPDAAATIADARQVNNLVVVPEMESPEPLALDTNSL